MPRNELSSNHIKLDMDIIVPVFNESERLPAFIGSMRNQNVTTSARIIFSDNCSTDQTPKLIKSYSKEKIHSNISIVLVDGSKPKSIGSARKVGVDYALSTSKDNEEKILLFVDADTVFKNKDYLNLIIDTFRNKNYLLVSFGPSEFQMSNGNIIKPPAELLRLMRRFILWRSFKDNNRTMSDFINPPYDIFPGHNFAVRNDALKQITGFRHEDVAADDVRVSLELQREFGKKGVVFLKRQIVRTDGRAYQKPGNGLSMGKVLETLKGRHKPSSINENLSATDFTSGVVRSFIEETERSIYSLGVNEYIVGTVSDRSKIPPVEYVSVKPARNLKTGEIVKGHFALIGEKK